MPDICHAEGCVKAVTKKGLCSMHYLRKWRTGSLENTKISYKGITCSIAGCSDRAHAHGLCQSHYMRYRYAGDTNVIKRDEHPRLGYTIIDTESASIELTRNYIAIVDITDAARVGLHLWHAVVDDWRVRAQSRIHGADWYLHQYILGVKPGAEIDHFDGNALNCKRSNLRYLTHQENMVAAYQRKALSERS